VAEAIVKNIFVAYRTDMKRVNAYAGRNMPADECRSLSACTANSSLPPPPGSEVGSRPRRCTTEDVTPEIVTVETKTCSSHTSRTADGTWIGPELAAALAVTLLLWSVPAVLALRTHQKLLKASQTGRAEAGVQARPCDLLKHLLGPNHAWKLKTHIPLLVFVLIGVGVGAVLYYCSTAIQGVYHTNVPSSQCTIKASELYWASNNSTVVNTTVTGHWSNIRVLVSTCILQLFAVASILLAAWNIVGPAAKTGQEESKAERTGNDEAGDSAKHKKAITRAKKVPSLHKHAKSSLQCVQCLNKTYQAELGSKRGRYHREWVLLGNGKNEE
jgi:hypothetical protein